MPPLYPPPLTVKLNTTEGYIINPAKGDSIQPVFKSNGDTLITGVPLPISGKVIDSAVVARAWVGKVGKDFMQIPLSDTAEEYIEPAVIPVIKDSLRIVIPGKDTSSAVLVNSLGDTIPTGVPVPVTGKVVDFNQPQPVEALPPRMKENAITNLRNLGINQGLISSHVIVMMQDSRGNLWIGSIGGGVCRYDGNTFTHYTSDAGIRYNFVRSILEDSHGNLWFGTGNEGVFKYDGHSIIHFTECSLYCRWNPCRIYLLARQVP